VRICVSVAPPLAFSLNSFFIINRRLICALAVLSGACGCAHERPVAAPTRPIHLVDLQDDPFDFWEKSQGKVVVVVFTRTDCPISNRFAPEIRRLDEQYRARGVNFYLVYVDPSEAPDAIRRHLYGYDYHCPGLRDPKHELVAYCGAKATPEAVVFGKDRTITYQGRISDQYVEVGNARATAVQHDLADAIEATVLGKPVATPRTKAIGCPIADLKE
jgi:hypothetical protein